MATGRRVQYIIDVDESGAIQGSRRVDSELKNVDQSAGQTQKSILRLSNVMKGAFVAAVGLAFQRGVRRAIERGREFESQLAELEAITGITGNQLDRLGNRSLELAKIYGTSASDIIEANKLVASQLAERIDFGTEEGFQQLQRVSEQTVVLAQAAGIELSDAVATTTSVINQFNLEASESERVINTLAAGAKFGAAEVPAIGAALVNAGSAAAGAGQSIETTNAAIQVLAANGQVGERAGTALRSIFTSLQTEGERLAKHGIHNVDVATNGLTETLHQLNPILEDTNALKEIFGEQAMNQIRILIRNADELGNLEEAVTGTNTAYEQAEVNMNTFDGAMSRLQATIDGELIPAFQETNGLMVQMINSLAKLIAHFGGGIRQINAWIDAHSDLRRELRLSEFAVDAQVQSIMNLREELAQYALENDLTAQQEKELQAAFDDTNRQLEHRIEALSSETDQLRERREEVQKLMDDAVDPAEFTSLRRELEGIDLTLQQNEGSLRELQTALQQGKIGWDDYLASQQLVMEAGEDEGLLPENTEQEIQNIETRLKALKEQRDKLFAKDDIDDDDVLGIQLLTAEIEALTRKMEAHQQIAEDFLWMPPLEEVEDIAQDVDQIMDEIFESEQNRNAGRLVMIDERAMAERNAANQEAQDRIRAEQAKQEAIEQTIEAGGRAAAQAILYARNTREAAIGVIRAVAAESAAYAMRGVFAKSGPLGLVIAPAVGAGVTRMIESLITFQRGGILRGPSHERGGIMGMIGGRPAVEMEGGEAVINKNSTRMFARELSAINQAGGGVPLARHGGLTFNHIPRDNTPLPSAGGGSDSLERVLSDLTRLLDRGIRANVAIRDFDEQLTDYHELQSEIGN